MNDMTPMALSRRALLQAAGALIVVGAASPAKAAGFGSAKPPLEPAELDSWVAVGKDGRITAYCGKMDVGQGADTAWAQIIGEELDLPAETVDMVMADTGLTIDQGGVSGSTGISNGGAALRNAAAEARRLLGEAAADHLSAPVDKLTAWDGVVSVMGEPARKVTYAELIGGRYFNTKLKWNGQLGSGLQVSGLAKPKSPDQYRVVGKPHPRRDVAGKAFGTAQYVTDKRLPGMLHARIIHPPTAGSLPLSVDDSALKAIPGAQVVRKDDLIAVLAPREWDAVKASEAIKVTWTKVDAPFPAQAQLYDHLRTAPVVASQSAPAVGAVEPAFAGAHKVISADYEWPFQAHASLGPACAVAEVTADKATVWTGTQKPHAQALGAAKLLGRPPGSVRVITLDGPGSYGRNDAGDAAFAALLLSSIVGKPVRVQGMRHEGTAWDPKGPASVHTAKAGVDEKGNIQAYSFQSRAFSRTEINFTENHPKETLVGQLAGFDNEPGNAFGLPEDNYVIPNRAMGWATVAPFLKKANPLRGSHLRDPAGPQMHFASESFFDEVAFATGQDPVEMRLKHMTNARDMAAIRAVAQKAGWKPGPPGARREKRGDVLIGRGIAYGHGHGTLVAIVAEVEVTPATGRIWARRVTVAHDCGRVVNPQGIHNVIEGNVVHGLSRTLFEEVTFDPDAVTSVDWVSYPILSMADAPETIDIVLMDNPHLDPSGAGEPTTRFIPAAVNNAFFDATGVRMRRAPLTRARVKAALKA